MRSENTVADVDADSPERVGGTADLTVDDLLDGLEGQAQCERAELIAWLLDNGFTMDHVHRSVAPVLLPANRVMGDDGVLVSARQMAEATRIDLEQVQQLQRALGLPRTADADTAVVPRIDAEAAARTKLLFELNVDTEVAIGILRVLMDGLRRAAAMMRQSAATALLHPGATELELARAAEARIRQVIPDVGGMIEGLLLLELRRAFEIEGVSAAHRAAERAAGTLPGARQVAVAFADLTGFTQLGESIRPEDLEGVASRLSTLARDVVAERVWFVKAIGDAVMLTSAEPAALVDTVLDLIDAAASDDLPPLRAGIAFGSAVTRAGDWFGSSVNLASRITGVAEPHSVLVSEAVRDAMSETSHLAWSAVGSQHLKGVPHQVALFRVNRLRSEGIPSS